LLLLHSEEFWACYEAIAIERQLKGWSRAKKLAYIRGDWKTIQALAKGKHKYER
jgi:predicted GIY-YIG superfamily endonuclease